MAEHSSCLSPPGISVFRKAYKVFKMAESKNLVTNLFNFKVPASPFLSLFQTATTTTPAKERIPHL